MMTPEEACTEARRIAGTGKKLAEACGRTHQAVYQWKIVPPECVLAVERLTGISRHVLRPDVFGPAEDSVA